MKAGYGCINSEISVPRLIVRLPPSREEVGPRVKLGSEDAAIKGEADDRLEGYVSVMLLARHQYTS